MKKQSQKITVHTEKGTTMSDYIKREHAIIRISDLMDCDMSEYFEDIPSADVVERKHGEWIDNTNDTYTPSEKCSECGHVIHAISSHDAFHYKFCPNCGARMKGVDDE